MAKRKWNKWIKQARAKYPNPIKASKADCTDCYCVGGAICRVLGRDIAFPGSFALDSILTYANPNLRGIRGLDFARRIISANDKGKFEKAWELADEALNFKPATK